MTFLIIAGAGPIALASGIEVAKAGVDFLVLQKGCLTNSIYNYHTYITSFSTRKML